MYERSNETLRYYWVIYKEFACTVYVHVPCFGPAACPDSAPSQPEAPLCWAFVTTGNCQHAQAYCEQVI